MDKQILKAYNELVGITLTNLYTLSKDKQTLSLGKFDIEDPEHLYMMNVAVGSASIIGKEICVDAGYFDRKKLYKMYPCEKFNWKKRAKKKECFDTNEVLDFMRPAGVDLTGDEIFYFGDIYEAFYERKDNEQ